MYHFIVLGHISPAADWCFDGMRYFDLAASVSRACAMGTGQMFWDNRRDVTTHVLPFTRSRKRVKTLQ